MTYSSSALRYRLIEGPVDLSPLRILKLNSIRWHGWDVTFHILGASHAVIIEDGEVSLTELLTCGPLANTGRIVAEDDGSVETQVCGSVQGLFVKAYLRPRRLAEVNSPLRDIETPDLLEAAYPGSGGTEVPITRIRWRDLGQTLLVETLHTYPEEGLAIQSRTTIDIQEDPA